MNPKDDLIRHFHLLRRYQLNDSHGGSASVCVRGETWITPRDGHAEELGGGDLIVAGAPQAARDADVHQAIYANNAQARAVLRSHGPYSVAMTLDNEEFIATGPQSLLRIARVPVISIDPERHDEHAPTLVSEVLAELPLVVVRGFGVYAWGESPGQAYQWTSALEHAARTAYIAERAGKL